MPLNRYPQLQSEPFLTTKEARKLLTKLVELIENAKIDEIYAAIICLLLFTGVLKSDILGLM